MNCGPTAPYRPERHGRAMATLLYATQYTPIASWLGGQGTLAWRAPPAGAGGL